MLGRNDRPYKHRLAMKTILDYYLYQYITYHNEHGFDWKGVKTLNWENFKNDLDWSRLLFVILIPLGPVHQISVNPHAEDN